MNSIIDPISNKEYDIFSVEGKHLLKKYVQSYQYMQKGGMMPTNTTVDELVTEINNTDDAHLIRMYESILRDREMQRIEDELRAREMQRIEDERRARERRTNDQIAEMERTNDQMDYDAAWEYRTSILPLDWRLEGVGEGSSETQGR